MPEKVKKIFRNVAAKRALWVLFDSNFCQKQVCRKDSVQKSVLKVNECRIFSASGCQDVSCLPNLARQLNFSVFSILSRKFQKRTQIEL